MEDSTTLWDTRKNLFSDTKYLQRHGMQGHSCRMTDLFVVKTGVRQGCLLSPFLFLLVIDWIMTMTTENRKNGIQWTLWKQLVDLDFADDLALLSHSQKQTQENTASKHCVNTDRTQHQHQ